MEMVVPSPPTREGRGEGDSHGPYPSSVILFLFVDVHLKWGTERFYDPLPDPHVSGEREHRLRRTIRRSI